MNTLRLILRLFRYRPWFSLLNGAVWTVIHVFPVAFGILMKAIFDRIADPGLSGPGVPPLLLLLGLADHLWRKVQA